MISGWDARSKTAATRHGLFAVGRDGFRLIAYGLFYGLTVVADAIYAFEAAGRPHHATFRGRIVRFDREGDAIVGAEVIATGLDNGCHQIDVVRGELLVLDTYNQKIVAMDMSGAGKRLEDPLPLQEGDPGSYRHVNSLLQHGDRTLLLLHNGANDEERRSELATFDADWNLLECAELDGHCCHSLALLEDGTLLSCGSLASELIGSNGVKVKLGDMMTRGLSVDAEQILVGGSTFASRDKRDDVSGAIYFLDRDYTLTGTLAMPAPVMEIRRIDGRDRSLSPYLASLGA